ncbi:MAG: substrate-binding domain-containing protein [Butyrivibrio sp.]|nr:substrate-binding domain-containing protein [Butyrivibrio sp.]
MKSKNLFIIVMSGLLIVLLLTSTSALIMSGMKEEPKRVSVVVDDSSSVRWDSFYAGLKQAARDYGVKLNIVATGKNLTLNQQYSLINDEIAKGASGVIVQFNNSMATESMIAAISQKAVLELVETNVDADVNVEGNYACIKPDDLELGRALANEVRIGAGNDLSDKKIGVVMGNQKLYSMKDRFQGFTENIESSGAEIVWQEVGMIHASDNIRVKQEYFYADIIVALDNDGLEAACEYAGSSDEKPLIFGEGISIKNVSYLDDGLMCSMVVPNEYYMGYQSLSGVVRRINNRLTPMQDETVGFRVVNRDNMFDESNQSLLFPIVE